MSSKKYLARFLTTLCALFFICGQVWAQNIPLTVARSYYLSTSGNDKNPGTISAPFKTITKVNGIRFKAGDALYFKSGHIFKGTLTITAGSLGNKNRPIVIASYGMGKATINGDSVRAISLYKTAYVTIKNLKLTGLGRKTGNREMV